MLPAPGAPRALPTLPGSVLQPGAPGLRRSCSRRTRAPALPAPWSVAGAPLCPSYSLPQAKARAEPPAPTAASCSHTPPGAIPGPPGPSWGPSLRGLSRCRPGPPGASRGCFPLPTSKPGPERNPLRQTLIATGCPHRETSPRNAHLEARVKPTLPKTHVPPTRRRISAGISTILHGPPHAGKGNEQNGSPPSRQAAQWPEGPAPPTEPLSHMLLSSHAALA